MKYYHEIKELLCDLRFFLESFYFFFNRIARYAQSKGSRNLLKKKRKSLTKQFLEVASNK